MCQARRHRGKRFDYLAVMNEMHKSAHGVVFRRKIGNACTGKPSRDLFVGADPYRQHRFGGNSVLAPIGVNDAGDRRSDGA